MIVRDAAGRRPRQTTIDPSALGAGEIGRQTGTLDVYFSFGDDVLTMVIQALVDRLPEPDRSCVRMTVMARLPYAEAGRLLGGEEYPPRVIDGRTIWRWTQRGLLSLQDALAGTPWATEMLQGRVPNSPGEVSMPDTPGFQTVVTQQLETSDKDI